jgi:hypothetical protein
LKQYYDEELKKIYIEEFLSIMSFSMNETIISMEIAGREVKNIEDYFTTIYTEYGACFMFNSESYIERTGPIYSSRPGPSYGLVFTIDSKIDDRLPTSDAGASGLLLMIHHPDVYPLMTQRAVHISTNTETYVAINKEIHKKLSKPYSNTECRSSDEIVVGEYKYSQELCLYMCLRNYNYNNTCSFIEGDNSKPRCTVWHSMTYTESHSLDGQLSILSSCDKCLPTCQYVNYPKKISTLTFKDKNIAKLMVDKQWPSRNLTYIQSNYARLIIYYETLQSVQVVQNPAATFSSIISDLGGLLGIFLGASISTLAEVIEFVILSIVRRCQRNRKVQIIA